MADINTLMIQIQSELKAPKNQRNSFGNYNYRSCEDILEAVKPLLSKAGMYITLTDDVVAVGEFNYVKATATVTNGTGEISVSALAREAATKKGMDDAQITGAASSYARKYALNGLFAIDDTKDADTQDNRSAGNSTLTSDQKVIVDTRKLMSELGFTGMGAMNRTELIIGKRMPTSPQDWRKLYDGLVKYKEEKENGTA